MLSGLIHDLRYGLRQLRRNPGFTAVAVLTLALGIGANTAIFSILDPLLLRKLPVQRPDELVRIDAAGTLGNVGAWEAFAFDRFNSQSAVFSGVLGFAPVALDEVMHDGHSNSAHGVVVSGNFFNVLGVQPYMGRVDANDSELGVTAVLGFDYWQREFGSDRTVLGKTILVQGTQRSIIGIAPPQFFGMRVGESADLYLPSAPGKAAEGSNAPALNWMQLIGRLRPGISAAQTRSALAPVLKEVQAHSEVPEVELRQMMDHIVLTSAAQGLSSLRYRFSLPARILMGVVGLILLIACANVANLLLARGSARKREITVRLALGARRSRLVRQLLTESTLLAGIATLAGLLLAQWTSRLLVSALSDAHTDVQLATGLNGRLLLFSLAVALAAVVLSGLAPAFSTTRVDISQDIKTYSFSERGGRARVSSVLVVAQVAMSVTALAAGGLLLHSLLNLETMPVGFDRDHILVLDMNGDAAGRTPEKIKTFYDQLQEKAAALPGVRSAALSSFAPVSGREFGINLRVPGYEVRAGEELKAFLLSVRPGYFSTLGIELQQGRDFNLQDSPTTPRVAVINRALAQHYFAGQDPIGKRLEFVEGNRTLEIIGVVANAKYKNLREDPVETVYTDNLQGTPNPPIVRGTLSVRAAGNMASLRTALPELVHSLDNSVRVSWVATLRERIDNSLHADRLITALCAIFSLLALTLTCIGLYGVLSFSVTRSTSEIGIRMALGAERSHIFRLFVGRGMRLVILGIVVGVVAAMAATSLLKSLLFGVGRADPVTFIGICLLLVLAAFAACFVPSRRATHVDPMVALRNE